MSTVSGSKERQADIILCLGYTLATVFSLGNNILGDLDKPESREAQEERVVG